MQQSNKIQINAISYPKVLSIICRFKGYVSEYFRTKRFIHDIRNYLLYYVIYRLVDFYKLVMVALTNNIDYHNSLSVLQILIIKEIKQSFILH
jgi:hypothetical protein